MEVGVLILGTLPNCYINDKRLQSPSVLKGTDYGAEIGLGVSFYLRYATISPEVKFSSY